MIFFIQFWIHFSEKLQIGLILCKDKSKLTVEYTLSNMTNPIGVSSFEILPKEVVDALPTEEDLNLYIDIDEDE